MNRCGSPTKTLPGHQTNAEIWRQMVQTCPEQDIGHFLIPFFFLLGGLSSEGEVSAESSLFVLLHFFLTPPILHRMSSLTFHAVNSHMRKEFVSILTSN